MSASKDAFEWPWLCAQTFSDGGWFRVKGYGLNVQRDRPVRFSERYGYRRVLRVGRWSIELLRPA